MITLGLHTPNPKDATSFYRAFGPWSELKDKINILPIDHVTMDWSRASFIDALFIHRPFSPVHLDMCKNAKKLGIPIWIDFDDDLFNVHYSNNNHDLYDRPQTQDHLAKIISSSDLVTVSTNQLATIYSQFSNNIKVIPNSLPKNILSDLIYRNIKTAPKKIILWRGTPHHEMNLHHYQGAFQTLMRNNPDWHFLFFGYRPWFIMERGNIGQSSHMASPSLIEYFYDLQNIQAAIQVVPLINHKFNLSKSNIAYLEGSGIGGSVCVVPDSDEWRELKHCSHYKFGNADSFVEATQRVIDMSFSERWKMADKAREYITSNHLSRPRIRKELLDSLLPS